MTAPADPLAAFQRLVEGLERLDIPFLVVGSLASSIHGIYRATADVDLVAVLDPKKVDPLVQELGGEFYADPEMIREALRRNRPFNLIHYASSYKFDLFPLSPDPYRQTEFSRRRMEEWPGLAEHFSIPVATAEDTILSKLVWYRSGGEVSENQWGDLRVVIEVKKGLLDLAYLRQWARHLGVEDLLERALRQSGLETA